MGCPSPSGFCSSREDFLSSTPPLSRRAPPGFRDLISVFALSLVSGAVSLGYQVMWFRLYGHRFGATNLTFLVVLVCFIGGLGLGSLVSRRLSKGLARMRILPAPLGLVGILETAIAFTALMTLLVDPSGVVDVGAFPYVQDVQGIFRPVLALRAEVGFGALLMLVPTFLMGTTFPILCHAFRDRAVFPSELYAWNTLGACAGVLAAEFLLLPHLGQSQSFLVLVAVNLVVGIAFYGLSRGGLGARAETVSGGGWSKANSPGSSGRDGSREASRRGSRRSARGKRRASEAPARASGKGPAFRPSVILAVATLSGFVAGSLEVDMFRAVRFSGAITDAAMSFTSFWAIVAIFTASWTVRALGRPRALLIRLAIPGALAAHGITWLFLPEIRGFFNDLFTAWAEGRIQADPGLAYSASVYPLSGSLLLLLGFVGVVVFPAYFLVSLLLPTVCNLIQGGRRHLGLAYGLNTLAFCMGAVLFTWVFPRESLFYAVKVLFVVLAVAALLAVTFRPGRPLSRWSLAGAGVMTAAGILLMPRGFDPSFFPPYEAPARHPVRAMKSNAAHTTFVVEAPEGDVLFFDSHPMSGTGPKAQRYMSLMAHVPLLAHPAPEKALLICFGVGNTARAIASHQEVEAIDIVDLNDKVFETAPEFGRTNGQVYRDPRVRLIHDDGRRFLKRAQGRYDLVTSEPPPPRAEGVYRLYSVEYYRAVLDHLTPRGMMTQWLPVNVLSREAIDRIVASFVRVFPHALLFVGSDDQLILMGGREPFDPAVVERRFGESHQAYLDLVALGVPGPISIFARILRIGEALREDVGGAGVISDERNDLTLTVTDPFDPPSLSYDPRSVLDALKPDGLKNGTLLAEALSDPARLRQLVPDFPGD